MKVAQVAEFGRFCEGLWIRSAAVHGTIATMTLSRMRRLAVIAVISFTAEVASAACVNRFVSRTERPSQVVTLLTGKLTFQEAQELARAIQEKKSPPLEWLDDKGRTIARQFGELKVVRPMPVGCDGKTSGVIVISSFATSIAPTKKMVIRFSPDLTVEFDQQAN